MNVYIYKQKSFDDLYQTTKCDITKTIITIAAMKLFNHKAAKR